MPGSRRLLDARYARLAMCMIAAGAIHLDAQVRRALVIGINTYHYGSPLAEAWRTSLGMQSPPERHLDNLTGALNDATAMRDVLISKFGFSADNVVFLRNEQATREGILTAVGHLVTQAQPGDIVLFYYAGHGSQRYNSLLPPTISKTPYDQTITPADANVGQFDVRNAELTALFDRALDKGVQLTLIFDSCNSGSAVRGIIPARGRFAPPDPRDARDPSEPESLTRLGRKNPAIVFAAAQEDQEADENERGDHGMFTQALLEVLKNPVNANAPAREVFQQVEALLRWRGASQVPVLKGASDANRSLFGPLSGPLAGRTILTMAGIAGPARDTALLDGGAAIGIGEGTELRLADSTSGALHLRIVGQPKLGMSKAIAMTGRLRELPGAVFIVDKWVAPPEARFIGWVPPLTEPRVISTAIQQLKGLRQSTTVEWVGDPTSLPDDGRPLYLVFRDAAGWRLRTPARETLPLPTTDANDVSSAIVAYQARVDDSLTKERSTPNRARQGLPAHLRPRVFVMLPPTPNMAAAVQFASAPGSGVRITDTGDSAEYALAGRIDGESVSYAWIRPTATRQSAARSALPARTNWIRIEADTETAAAAIAELGRRLSTLTFWLTADSHGAHRFPFHLAMQRVDVNSAPFRTSVDSTPTRGGEVYRLVLRRDTANHSEIDRQWVYAFGIDRTGRGQLIFGQSANQLPDSVMLATLARRPAGGASDRALDVLPLGDARFTTCPPYGLDTFLLVAANEPQPTPEAMFTFPAVFTDVVVLRGANLAAQSKKTPPMKPTVDDWSIERIVSRSGPPAPTDTALIRRALDKGDDQCKDDAERPITRAMLMSRTGLP